MDASEFATQRFREKQLEPPNEDDEDMDMDQDNNEENGDDQDKANESQDESDREEGARNTQDKGNDSDESMFFFWIFKRLGFIKHIFFLQKAAIKKAPDLLHVRRINPIGLGQDLDPNLDLNLDPNLDPNLGPNLGPSRDQNLPRDLVLEVNLNRNLDQPRDPDLDLDQNLGRNLGRNLGQSLVQYLDLDQGLILGPDLVRDRRQGRAQAMLLIVINFFTYKMYYNMQCTFFYDYFLII